MEIERILREVQTLIPEIDLEIEKMIQEKFSDQKEIERTLDYLMHPILESQFERLANYYFGINKTAAEDYKKIYKETWK